MASPPRWCANIATTAPAWLLPPATTVLKDASPVLAGRAVCVAFHPGWVRTDMGGAGADIEVADSAAGIRRTLASLTPADNGGFFNVDGTPLAW